MNRSVVTTKDGSSTIFVPELDEHYHSVHGALQESMHVFIKAGLHYFTARNPLYILEVGFGTGLNALLTSVEVNGSSQKIHYSSLEKYPVHPTELEQLNYAQNLSADAQLTFKKLHSTPWEIESEINPNFYLTKLQADLKEFSATEQFDLIYFDAFAPSAQANLWTIDIFERMYKALNAGGMLVTYCVKGEVRRNMQAAGFTVEKIPGPPGKREMARAHKA